MQSDAGLSARANARQTEEYAGPPSTSSRENREDESSLSLSLHLLVKWTSTSGIDGSQRTKMNKLSLKELPDLGKLCGLSKSLLDRAYPEDARPECITNELYYRWTPEDTCLSFPHDVTKTEFKLVAMYQGWEYVVACHELGQALVELYIAVIEFESIAVVFGNLGIRVSLVAYPVVCVRKGFFDHLKHQLATNPDFKGILS